MVVLMRVTVKIRRHAKQLKYCWSRTCVKVWIQRTIIYYVVLQTARYLTTQYILYSIHMCTYIYRMIDIIVLVCNSIM